MDPKIKEITYSDKGWSVLFKESSILPSNLLDEWSDELKLNNTPECIFGYNICRI